MLSSLILVNSQSLRESMISEGVSTLAVRGLRRLQRMGRLDQEAAVAYEDDFARLVFHAVDHVIVAGDDQSDVDAVELVDEGAGFV